jgi:hypothetical protein
MIRVYDEAGNVIEAHEHKGELRSGEQIGYSFIQDPWPFHPSFWQPRDGAHPMD